MRRRDFLKGTLKALAAVPLVASAAERPAKVVLAGQREPLEGLEDVGAARLMSACWLFDAIEDGDTFVLPRHIKKITEVRLNSEDDAAARTDGLVMGRGVAHRIRFYVPSGKRTEGTLWVHYLA